MYYLKRTRKMDNKDITKQEKELDIEINKLAIKRLKLELQKLKDDNKKEDFAYFG